MSAAQYPQSVRFPARGRRAMPSRGPALAGTGSRIVRDRAARLDEERMIALEDCLDL